MILARKHQILSKPTLSYNFLFIGFKGYHTISLHSSTRSLSDELFALTFLIFLTIAGLSLCDYLKEVQNEGKWS